MAMRLRKVKSVTDHRHSNNRVIAGLGSNRSYIVAFKAAGAQFQLHRWLLAPSPNTRRAYEIDVGRFLWWRQWSGHGAIRQ